MSSSRRAGPAARARHRVFLDANVLFSAAYREGSGLDRLWRLRAGVTLLSTPYAIEEARRNLAEAPAQVRLARFVGGVTIVEDVSGGVLPRGVELPDKDRPILLGALAARATHLLTGDRTHFGRFFGRRFGGMIVERPADYLRREHPRR